MPDGNTVKNIKIEVSANTKSAENGIDRLSKALANLNVNISNNSKTTIKNTANIRTNTSEVDKNAKAHSSAAKSVKSHSNGLARLGAALKRILIYRAIRGMIKATTSALNEGIERMYKYSEAHGKAFARVMDAYAVEIQYLKDSFGAAVAPLLDLLLPIITQLIDKFVELINIVNQFFRALAGETTWFKVDKTAAKFADDTEAAAKAQKKLNDQLMDFDQLNLITTPNDSGRGRLDDELGELKGHWEDIDPEIIDFVKHLPENLAKIAGAILGVVGALEALKKLWDWLHKLGGTEIPNIGSPNFDTGNKIDIGDAFDWDSFFDRLKMELLKRLPSLIADAAATLSRLFPATKKIKIKMDWSEYEDFMEDLREDDPHEYTVRIILNQNSFTRFRQMLDRELGVFTIITRVNDLGYRNFKREVDETDTFYDIIARINDLDYRKFKEEVARTLGLFVVVVRLNTLAYDNFKKQLEVPLTQTVNIVTKNVGSSNPTSNSNTAITPNSGSASTSSGGGTGHGGSHYFGDSDWSWNVAPRPGSHPTPTTSDILEELSKGKNGTSLFDWLLTNTSGFYANGGYPDTGSLFVAGEKAPEMVGAINGRTGVASGQEITGIAEAVYGTGAEEANLLRQLINAVREQRLVISPSASFGKVVNQSQRLYQGVTG
jgi:hypothetical protein